MSSSTPHVLMGHALYKLKDKVNNKPRGFAFVKIDPTFDNSEGDFDFLPVRSDITTVINGDRVEIIRLLAEAINGEESVKHELGVDEADLNLSEASSTNDTTLDECRSVTSLSSPIMLPFKYHDDAGIASIQSTASVSQVESNGNKKDPVIKQKYHVNHVNHKEHKNRKLEDVSSAVVNLAAEVVSKINAKEKMDERGLATKKDLMHKRCSTEHDEAEVCFRSRNAKEVLSKEDFNKLSKPFALGWKRECVTQDDSLISDIYYITPPRGNVQGQRLRKPSAVTKYLSEEGNESNLMLENFSFKRVFMGFEPRHELVRLSLKSNPPGENHKYENFFEIVAEDKCRCLLCGNVIRSKISAKARHVKGVHEPDVKCKKCGKDVRALHIQSHEAKCTAEFKVMNNNEMFYPAKRKAPKDSVKSTEKIQRLTNLGSPISPIQEFVDMKSSQPLCQGSTSSDRSPIVEKSAWANNKIEESVPDQHIPQYTESFNAQHGALKIPPRDQLPVPQEVASDIDLKKNCTIRMVTLEMSSVEGFRIKMQVKVNYKLVKVMEKFGVRMGVSYKDLRFILDGKELTGEELAQGLDGVQILVERRVS